MAIALGVPLVAAGAFLGLTLEDLYRARPARAPAMAGQPAPPTRRAAVRPRLAAPADEAHDDPHEIAGELAEASELPAVAPWDARPDNTELPAGHIPAWVVQSPAPDRELSVAAPVEPRDPARHRPSMHTPGGVDGERPPR